MIVTGFYIPQANPPSGETDGPLGALFLARALTPLGVRVVLATDDFCARALIAGVATCGSLARIPVAVLPTYAESRQMTAEAYRNAIEPAPLDSVTGGGRDVPALFTHLIFLERGGPSHSPASILSEAGKSPTCVAAFHHEVPPEHYDRIHTMRGRDITPTMSPAHLLIEAASRCTPTAVTIGIGDGGNEIGMGKIPWDIIRRNIPNGGLVACRVPTDYLIVCGVSNWGAYGLAAGVSLLRGMKLPSELFDPQRERELLRVMVERGPLVDGVSGQATVSVDGLPFERYAETLRRIGELVV